MLLPFADCGSYILLAGLLAMGRLLADDDLNSAIYYSKRTDTGWGAPSGRLSISRHEVHIWRANLNQPAAATNGLFDTLNENERARARRFHFERDERHFIVARGILRILLGRYMQVQPKQLVFTYNPYGKPSLDETFGCERPRFNLAHSRGLVYYAISGSRDVGIDVEYIIPGIEVQQLAERFFSPAETDELLALPKELQLEAFFNCWTRKEAYIKARGEGLSFPLANFVVSLVPGAPAKLLATADLEDQAACWTLHDLPSRPGYVAALAYKGQPGHLSCWNWPN